MKVLRVVGGCAGKTEIVRRPETVDLEKPGSGTWKHRLAGAQEVILASTSRTALLREMSFNEDEPDVEALLARLAPGQDKLFDCEQPAQRDDGGQLAVLPAGAGKPIPDLCDRNPGWRIRSCAI